MVTEIAVGHVLAAEPAVDAVGDARRGRPVEERREELGAVGEVEEDAADRQREEEVRAEQLPRVHRVAPCLAHGPTRGDATWRQPGQDASHQVLRQQQQSATAILRSSSIPAARGGATF